MSLFKRITPEDVHRRRWQLLALTSVGAFMWPLDGSIVSVALPVMGPDLHLSFTAAVWVSAAFLLTTAVLLIPAGRLADQRGRVRFYLLGIAVFTVASLLCAVSMNGPWLIVSRILQGVGAALIGATSPAIVTSVFPPNERGRALGINVMAVYIGLTVGRPLGGFIVDSIGWRWIFLINLPIGILVLVWGWSMLPRGERAGGAPRLDVAGSVLLGAFLVCLLVPLTFSPEWGWASPRTLGLLAVAAVSFVAFVLVERRVESPILDLDLVLKNRLFAAANTAALLNYMALYGVSLLTAIYLQLVQGRSASLTGWLLLTMPLLMAVLSPVSGRLSDRIGSRVLATGGMVAIAAGMVLLAFLPADAPLWYVVALPRRGRGRHGGVQRAERLGHHGQRAARPAQPGQRLPGDDADLRAGAQRRAARRHRGQPAGRRRRAPAAHARRQAAAPWGRGRWTRSRRATATRCSPAPVLAVVGAPSR